MFVLFVRLAVLLIFTYLAARYDRRSRKIPNNLILYGMITGLLLSLSLKEFLLKLLGILFLYFFGMLRLMGMGDLKLWMVIVCVVQFTDSCIIILVAEIFLILYALSKDTDETVMVIKLSFWQIFTLHKIGRFQQKGYAFAPFIFASALLYSVIKMGRALLL